MNNDVACDHDDRTDAALKTVADKHADKQAFRIARLAAVQALFQATTMNQSAEHVMDQFMGDGFAAILDGEARPEPDRDFFRERVTVAYERREEIDALVVASLKDDWSLERIDPVAQAILAVGIGELMTALHTPVRVILAEYSGLAYDFFEATQSESYFVSGVLNAVARQLRPSEFEAS